VAGNANNGGCFMDVTLEIKNNQAINRAEIPIKDFEEFRNIVIACMSAY